MVWPQRCTTFSLDVSVTKFSVAIASLPSNVYDPFLKHLVLPRVAITRNPDFEEVPLSATVTVTCSCLSYPASSIHWMQQTTDGDYITLEAYNVVNSSLNMFSMVTESTFTFNGSDISGESLYCCSGTNVIGTTSNCLRFTGQGTYVCDSQFKSLSIQ